MYKCTNLKLCTISVCFLLSFISNNAVAATCKAHAPKISIEHSVYPVEYVRDISSKELGKMHYGDSQAQGHIFGVAGGSVGSEFIAKFEAVPSDNNLFCLRLIDIRADFIAKPKIYIASNFSAGSCEYSNVLRHELRHVEILKKAHREYMPKYKAYLREVSRSTPVLPPMKLSEANDSKNFLIQHINDRISEYIIQIIDDVSVRQMEIDTAGEYRKQQSKCKKWEKKLNK